MKEVELYLKRIASPFKRVECIKWVERVECVEH